VAVPYKKGLIGFREVSPSVRRKNPLTPRMSAPSRTLRRSWENGKNGIQTAAFSPSSYRTTRPSSSSPPD